MSSTRHAKPGEPLNQERFCSSVEFEQGLLANLVARRGSKIENAAERELLFFLQYLSHQPGGLKKVASDILAMFPNRVGTVSMQKFGTKPGQAYSAEQVRQVQAEIPFDAQEFLLTDADRAAACGGGAEILGGHDEFLLRGELSGMEAIIPPDPDKVLVIQEREAKRQSQPESYPAQVFLDCCIEGRQSLYEYLTRLCLDPEIDVAQGSPWYFPSLIQTLRDFQKARSQEIKSKFVVTAIGRKVFECLDYSLNGGGFVLVEGVARIGKTMAAKAWCELHPGQARYVQVPASNDDLSFFRKLAESLGVSCSLSMKALQMRERIEYVLQTVKLMLVLDEATYLWPQNNRREALPNRINWLMTALVNYGVPVTLIATPQFTKAQKIVERKTGWASEQFIGRIQHYEALPENLSKQDLTAVARALLPEGDADCIEALVCYAQSSQKYLAGIESAIKRARYLAQNNSRKRVAFSDIAQSIRNVIPSDTALADALADSRRSKVRVQRRDTLPAPAIQPRLNHAPMLVSVTTPSAGRRCEKRL